MVPLTNETSRGPHDTGRDLKRQRAPTSSESQVDNTQKKSSRKNPVDVAATSPNSGLDFQALDGRISPQPQVPFRRACDVVSIPEVTLLDDQDLDSQLERATRLTGEDGGIPNYLQREIRSESTDGVDSSSLPQDILTLADGAENNHSINLLRTAAGAPNAPCVEIFNKDIWKQFSMEGYIPTKPDISMAMDELMRVATVLKKNSQSAENAPEMRNWVEHEMERASNDPSGDTVEDDTTLSTNFWKKFSLENYIPSEKDISAALDECFKLSRELHLASHSQSAEIADRWANRPKNISPPGPSEDSAATVPRNSTSNIPTKIPGLHLHIRSNTWEAHIWIDMSTFLQWHEMKYERTNALRARLQQPPVSLASISEPDGRVGGKRNRKRKDMQLYVGSFASEEEAKEACDMVNLKFSEMFQTFRKRLHSPTRNYAPVMNKYSEFNLVDFLWLLKRNSSGFKGAGTKPTPSSRYNGVCRRKASRRNGGWYFDAHISRTFKPADDRRDIDTNSVRIYFALRCFNQEKEIEPARVEVEAARLVDRATLFLNAITADQEREHRHVCTNFRPSEYSLDEILEMKETLLAASRPCLLNAQLHESVVKWWK